MHDRGCADESGSQISVFSFRLKDTAILAPRAKALRQALSGKPHRHPNNKRFAVTAMLPGRRRSLSRSRRGGGNPAPACVRRIMSNGSAASASCSGSLKKSCVRRWRKSGNSWPKRLDKAGKKDINISEVFGGVGPKFRTELRLAKIFPGRESGCRTNPNDTEVSFRRTGPGTMRRAAPDSRGTAFRTSRRGRDSPAHATTGLNAGT